MQTLFRRVWNDLDTIQIYIKDTRWQTMLSEVKLV